MSEVTTESASEGKQAQTFAQMGSISIKIEFYKLTKKRKKNLLSSFIYSRAKFGWSCDGCSGANTQIPPFKSEKLVWRREMHHDDSWLRVHAALFQKPEVLGYEFAKLAR